MNGIDFFLGIKVSSLHHKESDSDEDKVSNKNDECEDEAGLWRFKGCPDTDGDSIPDKDDACPKIPGPKQFKGCPDTDKDGIEDMKDECIDIPGLKEFNGCPDTDGDKIIDKNDSCATVKGLAIYHGCPDTDGDSIIDTKDACPTLAGPKKYNGCPDTDGDSILDNEDDCITVKGLRENRGCPDKDEDGDGVIDKLDDCPKTAGPAENKGCPVLQKEEVEILKLAFSNLEFETGKAIIKKESFASLDSLAALMVKKSKWKLKLAGHTDNVGDKAKNMKLSKDRTEAVAKYLTTKGVNVNNLIVEYYGPNKPIASNKTPEGRQRNRRVEMNIIFE
jgi:outer membrane protein OmpA-like peptidoglycan-associated protein